MADNMKSLINELGLHVATMLKERSRINKAMNRNKLPFYWTNDALVEFLDYWITQVILQCVDREQLIEWVRWFVVDVIQNPEQFMHAVRNFNPSDPHAASLRLQFVVIEPQINLLQGFLIVGNRCYWADSKRRMVIPKPIQPFHNYRY